MTDISEGTGRDGHRGPGIPRSIFNGGIVEKIEAPSPTNTASTSFSSVEPRVDANGSDVSDLEDEELDGESYRELYDERPNKFVGHPNTYRRWIAPERAVVDALGVQQANNLGLHLYCVEKLRKFILYRARSALDSGRIKKRRRNKRGSADGRQLDPVLEELSLSDFKPTYPHSESAGDAQISTHLGPDAKDLPEVWLPPDSWTTWPLKVGQVPNENDTFEAHRHTEQDGLLATPNNTGHAVPSMWMHELLTSLILRNARCLANERPRHRRHQSMQPRKRKPRKPKINDKGSEEDAASETDVSSKSEISRPRLKVKFQYKPGDVKEKRYFPVLLEDEDAIQKVVTPTIRSILSGLDRLLVCSVDSEHRGQLLKRLEHPVYSSSSEDEHELRSQTNQKQGTTSGAITEVRESSSQLGIDPSASDNQEPAKRKRGRPPSSVPSANEDSPESESAASTKTRRGRPRSVTRINGESYYMARKRRQSQEPYAEREESRAPSRGAPYPSKRMRTETTGGVTMGLDPVSTASINQSSFRFGPSVDSSGFKVQKLQSKPMDWRAILGRAALLGWNSTVLDRATQRCVDLFNEPMAFDVTLSGSATEQPVNVVFPTSRKTPKSPSIANASASRRPKPTFKPYWDGDQLFCPMPTCSRHWEKFETTRQLTHHCRKVHRFEPQPEAVARKAESKRSCRRKKAESSEGRRSRSRSQSRASLASDSPHFDMFIGGVRSDGFLGTIDRERGWHTQEIWDDMGHDDSNDNPPTGGRDEDETEDDGDNDICSERSTVAGALPPDDSSSSNPLEFSSIPPGSGRPSSGYRPVQDSNNAGLSATTGYSDDDEDEL
ncbi:hypothetical protein P152DRAFT_460617 [Eremomyces bilateralis CBS 781.70]|uniref:Rrn9 domain-containing protein n=1 Tax=Eremomyces bilateralis CBS 781.70 TaxID=1392243 RepID=A0A6G1FXT9_9PEZI|nr:uncharacterized protein P152DRAFT_460617 [Eremomyces bilateralis CBS 781.70]KAF1810486.1 hypothetical protein P152DRAFT_460617 [Eremomyces bilateralis CBS 781.70]